jgi:phospholipid/cholesterol/gamma-HCH transport system substrate-binding protein
MQSYGKIGLGVFLAGGVVLFALGLFWIGDRRQMFADNLELAAEFRNISGLARGAPVRVAGLDAGEVLEIGVPAAPTDSFLVRFRVTSNFQPIIRTDSVATIQTDGLVGNRFLQVRPGTDAAPQVQAGSVLQGRDPVEVSALLESASLTVASANRAVEDIRARLDETVQAILRLNQETVEIINRVGDHIDGLASTGRGIAENVEGMVADVRGGQGSLGRLLTDEQFYEDFRRAALDAQETINNLRALSDNVREISDGVRSQDLGARIDTLANRMDEIGANVEGITRQARDMLGNLESTGTGGLMTNVRETLNNTSRAMSNLADNTEALKRNFLFSGFFDDRGFFDINSIGIDEYRDNRFLANRQRIVERMDAGGLFETADADRVVLTEAGRRQIDTVMARYLAYSRNDPLFVEAYTTSGDPESILKTRDWAIAVRDYLVSRFELRREYIGIMPMSVSELAESDQRGDGIALVLFAQRGR